MAGSGLARLSRPATRLARERTTSRTSSANSAIAWTLVPAPRGELLRVLMLRDYDRVREIGTFYGNSKTRTFAELLIDCEESPNTRGIVIGMLREQELLNGNSGA